MKTSSIVILGLGLIILSFLYLNQCSEIKDLKESLEIEKCNPKIKVINDTIKIPDPYPVYLNPEKEIIYVKEPKEQFNISYLSDNYIVMINNNDSLKIPNRFLTTYPFNEKLLWLGLTKNKLNISIMDIQAKVKTLQYGINLEKYDYHYTLQNMTIKQKRKWSINPYLEYDFRLRNNLHDLTGGIKLNTIRFNYDIGLNGFYYPKFNDNLNWDIRFRITYNFK